MMKTTKKTVALIALAAAMSLSLGLTACGGKDNKKPSKPQDPPHDCTQVCPECGGCLDMVCENSGCKTKCGDDYDFDATFEVVDLKVAKANVTVVPTGYVTDFNKTAGGSIVYTFTASEAGKATLEAYVNKSAEKDVFTDVITVKVNDGDPLSRPSVIPALKENEVAAASVTEINLGCIDLEEGVNTITFLANGDGAHAHNFYKVTLIGDADFELKQATQVEHVCSNLCDTCGYCTDFSCYNPGCAQKCTCVSGGLNATLFWVCDERVETSRAVNAELDGIGCTWGQETRMVYNITADKAGTVKFGAVTSADTKSDVLFTDQFVVKVNGVQVSAGTGCMPLSETGKRDWNTYSLVVVGELTLREGRNEIVVSQTPEHDKTNQAYNFQSLVIFGEDEYGWFENEHDLEHVTAKDATCGDDGNTEYWLCSECGKLFADAYGETETTEDDVTIPADPTKHVGDLDTDDMTVTCDVCDTVLNATEFAASSSNFLFTGTKKDGYCENTNGTVTVATLNIESDKAGVVKLYVNDSSIATTWEIEFYKTWTVTVNGKDYISNIIHHNTSSTGADYTERATDFHYEYVCDIELVAGNNVIVFTSTGKESLNLKAVALAGEDFDLDWHVFPSERVGAVASTCTTAGHIEYWLETDSGKKYADEELTQELTDDEIALALDPTNHPAETKDGSKVKCSECDAFIRTEFNVHDSRNEASRATKDGEGIGSTWNQESKVTFKIYSEAAVETDLYAFISRDSKAFKFTDLFKIYINDGEALDTDAAVTAYGGRNWTTFDMYKVGKVNLVAGENTVVVSFTPVNSGEGAYVNAAFNFLKIALGNEGVDYMYTYVAAVTATCASEGNVEYYISTADGKKYADKALTTELTDEEIIVPADPNMHVGKLAENGITIRCSNCDALMGANFNGMDDNCVIVSSKEKNTTENCIPNLNANDTITFKINADKAGKAKLYVNCSAISTSWKVEFYKTWGVTVNGTEYVSETIHHYENDGNKPSGATRFTYFAYEFVAEVDLVAGENVIVLTATGKEGLNFKDIALMGDVELTWSVTETETPDSEVAE